MKMKLTLASLCFLLAIETSLAQDYHFIQFVDKDTTLFSSPTQFLSAKSIARRDKQGIAIIAKDYPVNTSYLNSVKSAGVEVIHSTKWLNGVLIKATQQQITDLLAESFVLNNTPISSLYGGTKVKEVFEVTEDLNYGAGENQTEMLELEKLHQAGFTGKGISIAVFDAGFPNLPSIAAFDSITQSGRLKHTQSFVDTERDFFATGNGEHGLNVFSTMGAYQEGQLIGAAYDADFYLFETEDVGSESPLEELNWLFAAEKADSLGVDIITTSLGYNDFDGSMFDFEYADLDGEKTIITQAADWAAEAGIFVVSSAGNEGNNSWGKITAPADGDFVLAVGAVNSGGTIASFSSLGPSADGRIKPDIMAQGVTAAVIKSNGAVRTTQGTSFSAPIMAGFVACLWQSSPWLTNKQLLEKVREAGHLSDTPNNQYGYGIPTYTRFQDILSTEGTELSYGLFSGTLAFPNPIESNYLHLEFPKRLLGEEVEVRLVDTSGRIFYQNTVTVMSKVMDVKLGNQSLSEGIYLLQLSHKQEQKALRLLVR